MAFNKYFNLLFKKIQIRFFWPPTNIFHRDWEQDESLVSSGREESIKNP